MQIEGKRGGERIEPLEQVTLLGATSGIVSVRDSQGREYVCLPAQPRLPFRVGGSAGYHLVVLMNEGGEIQEKLTFFVDARTYIADREEVFGELLQMLYYTMLNPDEMNKGAIRYKGRIYSFLIRWLRDHVHTLKGMKYFTDELKDGIDLYRDSQRADGMIWDFVDVRTPEPNYWDVRFTKGGFIKPFEDYSAEFKRIPVESDVEYLFVEGLYHTWKAVGDDGWMADSLDAAMKAMEYSLNSPYRWSATYQLLKRGYTIDTWDFQTAEDALFSGGDAMAVDPEKTRFGIMFGDNTGYAQSCQFLAEMLDYVGRDWEARRFRELGEQILQRVNQVSWNGQYYTHHVPEEPGLKRDLGVDEASQVSLSNAYSLNRGISHEQCVEIIHTYQRIKASLPQGSAGEWYTIYPPFQKGFGEHEEVWQFVNGGVTPIVAGELARGAFEHGCEAYGVDILQRLFHLGKQHKGLFHSVYTGAVPTPPQRKFIPLDLSSVANADIVGEGAMGVPGWTGEGENDLHEMPHGELELAGVPFLITDPAENGRRACIGLSQREEYVQRVMLPLGVHAASIYFLHAVSQTGPGGVGGTITLHYEDGSTFRQYVIRGYNVQGWWFPETPLRLRKKIADVAWCGQNKLSPNVGLIAYGLDNPYPDLKIERITLTAADDGAFWMVLGITVSDQPAYFPPSPLSGGIPDAWAAAAVVYALIEGLAGVVDTGTGYSRVKLSPRWASSGTEQVQTVVKYPDSQGYVAYRYHHDPVQNCIRLEITGSGDFCDCHVLLPAQATRVLSVINGEASLETQENHIESSHYVDFSVNLPGPHTITIQYAAGSAI